MISPQELRIGNLIYKDHPIEFGEYEVIEVQAEDESHFRINRNPDGYYPIALTEEILLKCGFEKERMNEHTDYYNLHPLHIFYNVANGFEYFHSQFGGKFIKITSLHQLQNLYFALVGKELDVKL